MKFKLLLLSFLFSATFSWGQVTIVSDGLNNATTLFTLTNGAYYTGNSAAGDRPATSPFAFEGTHSRGVSNASATLLSSNINTSGYASIAMSFKLASFSIGSTGNGADAADIVTVEVSPDGGTTWYSTVRVLGNSNANWAYTATGVATTAYDGNATPVNFTPAGGGTRTTDGYSNVEITNLPSITNLRFRITLLNNDTAERWVVDDFKVQGILASSNTITTNTALTGSPYCVSASTGASVSVPFTSVGTFTGNTYTAQLSNAAGSFGTPVNIGTLVSDLNSGTITATIPAGTAAGTGYRIRVVSNNPVVTGSDNTVNLTVRNAIAITAQPSNQVITDGSNTSFTVTATGTTPTYQWQVDTGSGFVNLSNGGVYSTVTTATLNITGATLAMNGYLYRCVVSGAAPCGSVTSNNAILTVNNTAPNNPTAVTACYGNTSVALSWTASTGTPPDGYMVFALQGATTPTATVATMNSAGTYTANTDFSLASIVTPASMGKCVYIGAGTSTVITGLTNATNYSFTVVAYRGNTQTGWSPGTFTTTGTWRITNTTVDVPEVTGLAASVASGQSALTWTEPTPTSCYQYLVVANQGAVVFTPVGDGSAYTANVAYAVANQVVYKGTGNGVTVTGLTNGLSYCYKVFVRDINTNTWSNGVEVCQTPNIVYCASGATNAIDSEIENVTLIGYSTTISNNTANVCTTGVNNYTAQSANVQVGGTYTVTVEFGDCDGGTQYNGAGGVWVDWNNDGDFLDANETIGTALVAVSGGNVIQNFTLNVPGGQPIGNYRMRIVQTEGGTLGTINPCGTFTYGSTEDYTVQVINTCIPTHSVTSFTPTSGPVGTEVTINGTGLTGTTVSFSGINATILSNNGTQIIAVIPAGANTGILSVKDAQPCSIDNAYTIIKSDNSNCEGTFISDLIIYDIHDEQTGSGGFITLYNGTAATVNLTNYSIWRTSNYNDGNEIDYANLTGTIAPGTLGIIKVSAGSCGPAATNGSIDNGFNENDGIQLRNAAGTVIIDDVHTYIPGPGYYMVRNAGALSARTSYVAADWSTTPLGPGVCEPSAGLVLPSDGVPPSVTTHPTYSPSCGSTSAILTTAGTEGFAGGLTLAYQWYFAAPGSATWTIVNDGGIYSGATTASLNISVVTGVINYQYYCQIRENGATCYTASKAVKIVPSTSTTWNGTTWSNGAPDLTKLAIINGNYNTAIHGDFSCCSLVVNATYTLDIRAVDYVEIQYDLTVNGTLNVWDDGSLVQVDDSGVNTGNINYERITTGVNLDYVYWSSPVNGVNTPATGYIYSWDPDFANPNGGWGYWLLARNTPMAPGVGYIMRNVFNRTFTGVPRNGVVQPTIGRANYTGADFAGNNGVNITNKDDNWNLIGNPYPSAINALDFLNLNANIEGSVRVWTHGTSPSTSIQNPIYNSYVYNYTVDDYIVYNGTGTVSGPSGFNGFIAGGQSFMVNMNDGPAATGTVTFNNSLRNRSHNNEQFYRQSLRNTNGTDEKHRIWLDLANANNNSTRTLIGYVSNATYEKDRLYDAVTNALGNGMAIFSTINNERMAIQGRALPFDNQDKVSLGIKVPTSGTYSIGLSALDGLFATGQKIYLEDRQLNVIHDLKANPYFFTLSVAGFVHDRFILRFTNNTLSNDDFEATENSVVIYANESINVSSSLERIKEVVVYDVLGRTITEKKNVNGNTAELTNVRPTQSALIVKVTLENNQVVTKKVIY